MEAQAQKGPEEAKGSEALVQKELEKGKESEKELKKNLDLAQEDLESILLNSAHPFTPLFSSG